MVSATGYFCCLLKLQQSGQSVLTFGQEAIHHTENGLQIRRLS